MGSTFSIASVFVKPPGRSSVLETEKKKPKKKKIGQIETSVRAIRGVHICVSYRFHCIRLHFLLYHAIENTANQNTGKPLYILRYCFVRRLN